MILRIKPKGQHVIVTHGRYKGETGITEGSRVSSNYETMIYVRRDKKKVRDQVRQFPKVHLAPTGIGEL